MANLLCRSEKCFSHFLKQNTRLNNGNLLKIITDNQPPLLVSLLPLSKNFFNGNILAGKTIPTVTGRFYSSFGSSEVVPTIDKQPEIEVIKNPVEWQFVERLLGKELIPRPVAKSEYPSGWRPPTTSTLIKENYFIARTRNHMLPVYVRRGYRGQRRLTMIRYVDGDIWQLETDLRTEIERVIGKKIGSRINEMCGQVIFKGDFEDIVKDYLLNKGF